MAKSNQPKTLIGQVVSNLDPEFEGKINVFIASKMDQASMAQGIQVRPKKSFLGGIGKGSFRIPQIGDYVKITFEQPEILQDGYYEDPPMFSTHKLWNSFNSIKSLIGLSGLSSQYPNVIFFKLQNGIAVGVSEGVTPEVFIYHPTQANIHIDASGNIHHNTAITHFFKSLNPGVPVASFGDGLYEVACVGENMVATALGPQPIQPTTNPSRLLNKMRN
jgi:hypothetical protein